MSCNDIPSLLDLQQAKLNADDFGRLMGTGTGTSTNGVTGQVRPTYNKVINDMNTEFDAQIINMGFTRIGTFASGATITNPRQTLLWDVADGGDGQEYGWSGAFPKVVPATSTPASTGGISVGAWISRFDPELRIQVREDIINIAGRTFKTVADMKSATNLKEGQSVKTNGYSSAGDGRGASYIIKTYAQAKLDGDAVDGYLNHISSDGLYVAVIQLEKQKPNKNWDVTVPTACAHRGLSAFTPENSIISLAQAWESGFKYAEVDLYPCLDDLLILHDSTLDRTTNGAGDVGVMTSAQVKQYNMKASGLMILSLRASFDVYFPNEKVPTLDEFFAEIRRTGLNVIIECKIFSDSERIEFLNRLVASGLLSQVMLQSTNFSVIEHFKSLDSRVEIGLINPVSQPIDYGNVDRCAKIGAWLNTDASKLTEADAQYAKGKGVRLACYTANTQAMYQTMQRYGVNLILSDYLSKGY